MARGVNKVIIIGNLGADPETRYVPNGSAITNLRVATSESWKDKESGQTQERTEWHRIVLFGRLAEIATQYLRKGSKVYIEGSLRTNKWQDKATGADRYSTDIIGNELQMLDSRGGAGAQSTPAYESQSATSPSTDYGHSAPSSQNFDDDIPF